MRLLRLFAALVAFRPTPATIPAAPAARTTALGVFALARRLLRTFGQLEIFRRFGARDFLLDEAFDLTEEFLVRRDRDRDRRALAARATRAADPVDVVLGMHRQVVVEDVAHRRHVEAARGHVGGDQQLELAIAEILERARALALVEIAMDRGGVEAVFLQALGDDIDIDLAVTEDDRVGAGLALGRDHRAQQFALGLGRLVAARRFDLDQLLGDVRTRGRLTRNFDPRRRMQEGVGDPLDLRGHRGREEQRLAREGRQLEYALDIRDEAHVEHPVGLVDDHDLHIGQDQFATLEMVEQAAWRRDQHVDALVDQLVLLAERHAADQQRTGQLGVLGVEVEVLGDLGCQFAGRAENERARHPGAGAAPTQQRQHRQGEAGGLAGPGLRDAEHVLAFERGRNGASLNGRGLFVASVDNGGKDFRVQLQIGEFSHGFPWFTFDRVLSRPASGGAAVGRFRNRAPRRSSAGLRSLTAPYRIATQRSIFSGGDPGLHAEHSAVMRDIRPLAKGHGT